MGRRLCDLLFIFNLWSPAMKGLDYHMDGLLDEHLNKPQTLSASDEEFIKAYDRSISNAPEDVVREYLLMEDPQEFYKLYREYYESVSDAYSIWCEALDYRKKP